MSTPESHELESFFEKLTQPPPEHHTAHGQGDPAEEFNALFKKLSSLDELNWAPEANRPAPAKSARPKAAQAKPQPETPTPAPAAEEAAAPAAVTPPKLTQEDAEEIATVIAAHTDDSAEDAEAVAPPARPLPAPRKVAARQKAAAKRRAKAPAAVVSADAVTASAAHRPSKLERAGRVLKIATVSLALFGIGLGAVWAALTLPHRVNHAQPTVAERAIPNSNRAATETPAVELPATAAELQVTEVEAKPVTIAQANKPNAPAANRAQVATAAPAANTANHAAPAGKSPAANVAPAAVADSAASQGVAVHTAETGGFALQVGACASEQCLANYRNLLTNFVTPDTIRVIAAPSGEGATVQRVRIAPLELEQARKLKVAMAADARLRNAYVITLN